MHKHENINSPGLLKPILAPNSWEGVCMDFITGLPKSEGRDILMVVVDRFTKSAHFIALSHPISASKVAKVFFDHVYKLHGLPSVII